MALFDIILENVITEGYLSSADMKSQLSTVIIKVFNGQIDMSDGNRLNTAIQKCARIKKSTLIMSIEGEYKDRATKYYQHRFFVEDIKGVLYQFDIWSRPDRILAKTSVTKIYDKKLCDIPEQYVTQFLGNYTSTLMKQGFVGYPQVNKNTMGIYAHYRAGSKSQDEHIQSISFEKAKPTITKILNDIYSKNTDKFEYKSKNELKYIG